MTHIDIEDGLYLKAKEIVERNLRYANIRHFINLAVAEKVSRET